MNNPKSITRWIAGFIVLQVFTVITLSGGVPVASVAHADGIPDAGDQRAQIIEQMKATNEKLDKLLALLSSGDLQVKLPKVDDGKGHE